MYFKSREAAGKLLAGQIAKKYQHEDCAVIALSDGGVLVGMHVAMKLRCVIMMLMSKDIELPKEPEPIGGITMDGYLRRLEERGELEKFEQDLKESATEAVRRDLALERLMLDRQTVFTDEEFEEALAEAAEEEGVTPLELRRERGEDRTAGDPALRPAAGQ